MVLKLNESTSNTVHDQYHKKDHKTHKHKTNPNECSGV